MSAKSNDIVLFSFSGFKWPESNLQVSLPPKHPYTITDSSLCLTVGTPPSSFSLSSQIYFPDTTKNFKFGLICSQYSLPLFQCSVMLFDP